MRGFILGLEIVPAHGLVKFEAALSIPVSHTRVLLDYTLANIIESMPNSDKRVGIPRGRHLWMAPCLQDAGEDTWQEMGPWKMPRLLFDFCAAQVDETHLMIVGGNEAVNNYVPNVSILDTETAEWRETEPLPVGMAEHECIVGECCRFSH